MSQELKILIITAASMGFLHTIFGPDHYLPFIAMSKARGWTMKKTALITILCGIGHIMSSVVLGIIGIILSIQVMKLEVLEAFRGNLAAWGLIGFGFAYFLWGIRQVIKNKQSINLNGSEYIKIPREEDKSNITPWILFTIFVLGPCESLIPILMYPAAKNSIMGLVWVTVTFGSITVMTMFSIVMIASFGINLISLKRMERYTHAIAGATIFLCGLTIQFLGL